MGVGLASCGAGRGARQVLGILSTMGGERRGGGGRRRPEVVFAAVKVLAGKFLAASGTNAGRTPVPPPLLHLTNSCWRSRRACVRATWAGGVASTTKGGREARDGCRRCTLRSAGGGRHLHADCAGLPTSSSNRGRQFRGLALTCLGLTGGQAAPLADSGGGDVQGGAVQWCCGRRCDARRQCARAEYRGWRKRHDFSQKGCQGNGVGGPGTRCWAACCASLIARASPRSKRHSNLQTATHSRSSTSWPTIAAHFRCATAPTATTTLPKPRPGVRDAYPAR